MDFFIIYEKGNLDNSHQTIRVRVKNAKQEIVDKIQVGANRIEYEEVKSRKVRGGKTVNEKVKKVRSEPVFADVSSGYGNDRASSITDFIRRNSSKVLNAIFDYKGE